MYTTTQVPQTINYSISKDDWALKTALADSIARCFPYANDHGIPDMIRACGKISSSCVRDQGVNYFTGTDCKRPLCPTCDRKRAKQREAWMDTAIKSMAREGTQFVFLTLTQENCKPEELMDATDDIVGRDWAGKIGAWHVFEDNVLRGKLAPVVKGWAWKLEFTYNRADDSFHPHMHILIAVKDNYFPELTEFGWQRNYYQDQPWWCNQWKQVMSLKRKPVCYIEKSDLRIAREMTKPEIHHDKMIFPDNPDLTDHVIKPLLLTMVLHKTFGVEGELGEAYRKAMEGTRPIAC